MRGMVDKFLEMCEVIPIESISMKMFRQFWLSLLVLHILSKPLKYFTKL